MKDKKHNIRIDAAKQGKAYQKLRQALARGIQTIEKGTDYRVCAITLGTVQAKILEEAAGITLTPKRIVQIEGRPCRVMLGDWILFTIGRIEDQANSSTSARDFVLLPDGLN